MTSLYLMVTLSGAVAEAGPQAPVDSASVAASDSVHSVAVEAMYVDYRTEFAEVPEVEPTDLRAWLQDSTVVLVDVRETREREVSMILGAISRKEYETHPEKYEDIRVVVYCTIGYRSGRYTEKLRRRDVDAWNLARGILGWAHAGAPVENQGERTPRVHVYGKQWSLLPVGYEPVW